MALKIRPLTELDLIKVRNLRDKHYPDEQFPDFKRLLTGFIIEDESNEIVMAGGVRAIGEALLITNKDKSRIKIGKALVEAQRVSLLTAANFQLDEIVAFVDDPQYALHLIKHGFSERGRALNMDIDNG